MKHLSVPRCLAPGERRRQRGLTLVELMVAVTLGILVAGAAVATLLIARQGFASADASSQLRENARYAAGLIERIAVEAGFENAAYGSFTGSKLPGLRGYDNALVSPALASLPNVPNLLASNTRTSANCGSATGNACQNNSDVLVVRFWGSSRNGTADQSMINCAGIPEPDQSPSANPVDPRAWSIFHVATGPNGEANAEPSLACTYLDPVPLGQFKTRSIVKGVESFKVLYGTFGVTKGSCSAPLIAATAASTAANFALQVAGGLDAPSIFLSAEDMDPGGVYCPSNWARVRALRIGLLVRSDSNAAISRVGKDWNVLGDVAASAAASINSVMTIPAASAADGRLRQQFVFTIYLRNAQFAP